MQNMNGKTALGLDANVGAMLCYLPLCGIRFDLQHHRIGN